MTVDDVIKEAEDTATGNSNYTYTNNELDNKVVITNDSGVVDYSLIDMTVVGGKVPNKNEYYSGLLVATNDRGLIDYSFIDKTQTTKANTLVQTNSSGVINLNLLPASTSPKANSIPISTAGGSGTSTIDNGWINSTVSDATPARFVLTSSTGLIDNNLLKKSSSSATNTLVVGDSNGKINDNWLVTTNDGKDNPNGLLKLNNGKIGIDVIPDDKYVPISGGITDGNILINGPSPNTNTHKAVSNGKTVYTGLTNLKGALPNFVGIGGNSYQDGFLVGMNGSSNTNNYLMIATYDEGNEPIYVRQYTGNPGYSGLTQSKSITLMDASGNTALNTLTVTNNITSTSGVLVTKGTGNNAISGSLSVEKTSALKGNVTIGNSSTASTLTTYGTGYFVKTTDLSGIANNKPALIVGGTDTSAHLEIDSNEIQAKADGTNPATIGINLDGGNISIGNNDKNTVVTLRKNTSITGTASIAGNATVGSSSSRSTLTSYGLVTADNGLTVNNAVLTANKGAIVKGALLDAQAGTKTTTLLTTSTATIGASASAPANLVVYGTSTLTGAVEAKNGIKVTGGNIDITTNTSSTSGIASYVMGHMAGSDDWRIAGGSTGSDAGFLELAVADNGSENIYVRKYKFNSNNAGEHFYSVYQELKLLDGSGNTELPGTLKVKGTGDSSFAGKLTTGSLGTGAITSTGITNTGTLSNTGALSNTGNVSISGTLSVTSSATIGGLLTANGRIVIPSSGDKISSTGDSTAPLIIGTASGIHLSLDQDEISARSNSTGGQRALYLQPDGGDVVFGGNTTTSLSNLSITGTVKSSGLITANGGVRLGVGQTLSANMTSSRARNIIVTEAYNSDGDNCYYTGGSNLTVVCGGDSYTTWHNYVTGSDVDANLWDIPIQGYSDRLYMLADTEAFIETNIQSGYAARKSFKFDRSGNLTAPGTVTATNFSGKWAGYTQDIGTKPSIADATWILLNNNAKIQHTTIGDIATHIKSTVGIAETGTYYTKLANGLKIQWGSGIEKGSEQIISFPIAFNNTNYQVVIAATNSYGGADPTYVKSKTTTGFYASNDYWSNMTIYWIAIGY